MATKDFQFGIGLGLGFPQNATEQIRLIAQAGYDACFTGWSEDCEIEAWANEIARQGLIYQSVHAPFGKVHTLWEEGEAGEQYTNMLISCLRDCARVGVGIMVSHVIIGMDRHTPTELGLVRFGRLVEAAEKYGVTVAFENTEGLEYLQAVMDALGGSSRCGFCWDTGHEQCYNYGEDMMARFGDKLVATHINDNLGMADRQVMTWLDDSHLLPFDGINKWDTVAARLDSHGYQGIMTMELTRNSKPGKTTHDIYAQLSLEQFLALALERCRKIAAMRTGNA